MSHHASAQIMITKVVEENGSYPFQYQIQTQGFRPSIPSLLPLSQKNIQIPNP